MDGRRHTTDQSRRFEKHNRNKRSKYEDVLQFAPRDLCIPAYVEKRVKEITSLAESTACMSGYRLTSQQVPRHMRRRAMSHNIKRLPRRLHQVAAKDFELEGKAAPSKRPSRKHRRRPRNLLAEYERRRRKHIWLETHIWHAKRFKMEEKWGYKIAVRPRDKSFRALYRASVNHCMLQDTSYMCCIELLGQQHILLDGISYLTNADVGLTIAAKSCLRGNKEGHVTLFLKDQYPSGVIGRVSFMWRPVDDSELLTHSDKERRSRQLWIWCHPAFRIQVWKELLNVFEIPESVVQRRFSSTEEETLHCKLQSEVIESMKDDGNGEPVCKKARLNPSCSKTCNVESTASAVMELSQVKETTALHVQAEDACVKEKASPQVDVKTHSLSSSTTVTGNEGAREAPAHCGLGYLSASSHTVTLNLLQDNLVRFSLTGSLSQSVLSDLFHKPSVKHISSRSCWWRRYAGYEGFTEQLNKQWNFWNLYKTVQSPAEWPPNAIIGLTIRDPRVFLPQKKFRASTEQHVKCASSMAISSVHSSLSSSPLWDAYVRDAVSREKLSDKAISDARAQLLVPGTELSLGEHESRVPVILIQRPGKQSAVSRTTSQSLSHQSHLGYGSGWDVILPKGMARAFWVGLIYRGARPGGVRDMDSIIREQQNLRIPIDYPDSEAGQAENLSHRRVLYDTYYRKPPAKRPNYCKLGTVAPFHSPWPELIRDWKKHQQNGLHSNNVDTSLDGNNKAGSDSVANYIVLRSKKTLKILSKAIESCPNDKILNRKHGQQIHCKSEVLPASLNMLKNPEMLGIIKQYEHSIVPVILTMCLRGIPHDRAMICIPSQLDLQMYKSDSTYSGPKEQLHIPAKAHKFAKKKQSTQKKAKSEKCGSGKNFEEEMGKLLENVVDSADRTIIGYVTNGAFSYLASHGAGVGLCSMLGFMHWRSKFQDNVTPLVLVRSPSSMHYKFATIAVIV